LTITQPDFAATWQFSSINSIAVRHVTK